MDKEGTMPVQSGPNEVPIIETVRGDPRVEFIGSVDEDRHLVRLPIETVEHHEDLSRIRGDDPESVDILAKSMKRSGGAPLYSPLLFIQLLVSGVLRFFVADGHQRLRAARQNGDTHIICVWVSRWQTAKDAMEECISANFARWEMGENDVFSIISTGKISNKEIQVLTGFSESKIGRLEIIAEHPKLVPLVKEKLLGATVAVKLVKACNRNPDKLNALVNTLIEKATRAKRKAEHWRNLIRNDRRRKYDKSARAKADPKSYFKDIDWASWEFGLEGDDAVVTGKDGQLRLKLEQEVSERLDAARVGDSDEWRKSYAIFGLFERDHDRVHPEDLRAVLDDWDAIRLKLEAIYENRMKKQVGDPAIPTTNPVSEVEPPDSPTQQDAEMEFDASDSDES